MKKLVVYILFVNTLSVLSKDLSLLLAERARLLEREQNMMLGSDLILSDSEERANDIIMDLKHEELDNAFDRPEIFNYSKHFFDYKEEVKDTELFKIIQKMPKGAVLHVHDIGLLSPDYMVELTYWPNLYACVSPVKGLHMLFSENLPNSTTCEIDWVLLLDLRYSADDVETFDADLRTYFTMVINKPNVIYRDINQAWMRFQDYFEFVLPFITYKPVWEQYFYDTLKAFREDNVMYIELRGGLPKLYDLQGNIYDSVATAESYKKVSDQFKLDYPDFFGVKLIYAPMRSVDVKTVEKYLQIAKNVKATLPNFLAGFDLVGQEDLGLPLEQFLPVLWESASELDYFFHAGETNWYGTSSDENLVDAILLGTRRIGHAFALIKHPLLLEEVKKKDIALEVNVVSNTVLKLVEDLRNHPLASLIAQNMPVVLSSDDPGIWEALPMSHDFYVAFMGVMSQNADLRVLKKLALNSLYYSTYPDKDKIVYEFEIRWTRFIDSIVKDNW